MISKTKKVSNNGLLPIGAYEGPFPKDPRWPDEPNSLTDATYRLARSGGFNFMIGYAERYPANIEEVARSLECAANNGMRMVLSDANVEQGTIEYKLMRNGRMPNIKAEYESSMAHHGEHPGYWGCYIVDEPLPNRFPMLADIRDVFYEVSPNKLCFINMLPTYAVQSMAGVDWLYDDAERDALYTTYVTGYLDTVRPEMFCYDYYPYLQDFPSFGGDFFVNLAIVRRETQKRGIAFWVSPQASIWGDPNCRGLSIGEMRHQVYTSLAFGATGLVYYCWSQHVGNAKTQALAKGEEPTYLFNYAKECNLFTESIGKDLLENESLGVVVAGTTPGRIPDYALAEDRGNLASVEGAHALVGVFANEKGFRYMAVNNSILEKDEIVLTFRTDVERTIRFTDGRTEKITGKEYTFRADIGDCVYVEE